jgi:hypothetical protein
LCAAEDRDSLIYGNAGVVSVSVGVIGLVITCLKSIGRDLQIHDTEKK